MGDLIVPMPKQTVQKRSDLLDGFLHKLAECTNITSDADELIGTVAEIYEGGYRHLYSEIGQTIQKMSNDLRGSLTENLENLRETISERCLVNPGAYPDYVYSSVLKLSDHINLEIQRNASAEQLENSLRETKLLVSELRDNTVSAQRNLDNISKHYTEIESEIRRHNVETVTVLAIFAAVVLAFSGGVAVLGNAVGNVNSDNLTSISFVVLLTGIVLFDIVTVLMMYVFSLTDRFAGDEGKQVVSPNTIAAVNTVAIAGLAVLYCL